jgi:hypothetical protein
MGLTSRPLLTGAASGEATIPFARVAGPIYDGDILARRELKERRAYDAAKDATPDLQPDCRNGAWIPSAWNMATATVIRYMFGLKSFRNPRQDMYKSFDRQLQGQLR